MIPIQRLLRPKSIAVFGGQFAEAVIRQCDAMGYKGDIWPVHPTRREILGHPCTVYVEELPHPPDAAFVGINRLATIDVVRALAALGAGGIVCYASGFKEVSAEGVGLQDELVKAAAGTPMLGPNCYGFINYLDGALLWPDVHGGRRIERGVAIVTQSSNIGVNLTMSRRGVPLAYLITVGNQAVVGLHDTIQSLCDDSRVTAIGVYIEGITDVGAFSLAIEYAHAKGVPIVVLKSGRTDAAQRLALSHTASLSGSDVVMDAYFRRLGVARVDSIPALLESLKMLHITGPLKGRDIVSLSCSGGEASVMSDTARTKDVNFRPFAQSDLERIRQTVNPLVNISNPFDYHTFDWGDEERLCRTFTAVMESGFDLTALILDFPSPRAGNIAQWDMAWRALAGAAEATGRSAAVVATLPECLPEEECERLTAAGLIPFLGMDDALAAIDAAAFIGESSPGPVVAQAKTVLPGGPGGTRCLNELKAKALLQKYGVAIPEFCRCASVADALNFWRERALPLAMKAVGDSLAHKTDLGGVILGINSEQAVVDAYHQLSGISDGVFAEVMVDEGVAELIVGAGRDPVIGLYLIIGMGGTMTEAIKDSSVLLLPYDRADIDRAVGRLHFAPVLRGWRGQPPADMDAVAEVLFSVQRFMMEHLDTLQELDINPLIVGTKGAVAVDALISFNQ